MSYFPKVNLYPANPKLIEAYNERGGQFNADNYEAFVFYTPGSVIRHALTGDVGDPAHRRGSKYEDLYFSVTVAGKIQDSKAASAQRLYFYSPNECERTLGISLSAEVVEKWEIKRNQTLHSIGMDICDTEESSKKRFVTTRPTHSDMYYPTPSADGGKTTTVHIRHFSKPIACSGPA